MITQQCLHSKLSRDAMIVFHTPQSTAQSVSANASCRYGCISWLPSRPDTVRGSRDGERSLSDGLVCCIGVHNLLWCWH